MSSGRVLTIRLVATRCGWDALSVVAVYCNRSVRNLIRFNWSEGIFLLMAFNTCIFVCMYRRLGIFPSTTSSLPLSLSIFPSLPLSLYLSIDLSLSQPAMCEICSLVSILLRMGGMTVRSCDAMRGDEAVVPSTVSASFMSIFH